jgi:tetratricopeptide (TPR) repeat protein
MSKETKSNDLLDEAYDTISKIRAKKLARQALEIWPYNIDAEGFIADFEENQIKKLSLYEKIVKKATMLLESEELFDEENIGHFWGIIETRPYMRARAKKITILEDLGRYTEAIREYEEMLRLCRSDNLGLRYKLMALYCMLEKFDECEKLYKQYNEESAYMLFLMAFVYFKKGDYRKSKKYIMELNICNKYVYRILNNDSIMIEDVEYYAQGSIEEASMIIEDLFCLLGSTPSIIKFMQITLN